LVTFVAGANQQVVWEILDATRNENGVLRPEAHQRMKALVKRLLDAGLFVNLNHGQSAADEKAKLMFEVTDVAPAGHGHSPEIKTPQFAVKLKSLNKKYCGTSWWIDEIVLLKYAQEIPCPFRSEPNKSQSKSQERKVSTDSQFNHRK
jgi:hypothetical protein